MLNVVYGMGALLMLGVLCGTGAAPSSQPTPSGSQAPEQSLPAKSFPESWIGHWKGDALYDAGNGKPGKFQTELFIAATDKPDRFQWTIIYNGAAGRQERKYTLVVKNPATGDYEIDENNGIVLRSRLLDGALYNQFLVQGNRISARYALVGVGADAHAIELELVTIKEDDARETGGKDGVPAVRTWVPVSVQKSTMKRVTETPKAVP